MRSPKGGAPIVPGNPGNSGGKKGRSGRKPNVFKELATEILHDPQVQKEVRAAAKDRTTPGYGGLIKALAAYSDGLPVQPHEHKGNITFTLADRMKKARERAG